jgi:phage-related protein
LASACEKMILLHGYEKRSKKAPRSEIQTAERRMREILG